MLAFRITFTVCLLYITRGLENNVGEMVCGYRCNSGECIQAHKLCDGMANCLDSSDESAAVCEQRLCANKNFRCKYGACIAASAVCDGSTDCLDGSDEQRWLCKAQVRQGHCNLLEMHCLSGHCVSYSKLCNGDYDCIDGDDETSTMCEGAWSTVAPELIHKNDTDITLARRQLIYPVLNISCILPELSNVIVKNSYDSTVLYKSGERVPNSTRIYYACQGNLVLTGPLHNICHSSKWMHEFSKCEPPPVSIFSFIIVILLFAILLIVSLVFAILIYVRRLGSKQHGDRILLVENLSLPTIPRNISD